MVDATGVILRKSATADNFSPMVVSGAEAAQCHASVCEDLCPAPSQHPVWVANWMSHSGTDAFVAVVCDVHEEPVLSLPLQTSVSGGVKVATYQSGSHANGNFPAIRPGSQPVPQAVLVGLVEEIAKARPDIDLLLLERQAATSNGVENPFLAFPHSDSPNPALAVSLDGGFDAVLARSSGKRKRKKHRSQVRKFESLGDWRRYRADTPSSTEQMLNAFFVMKAERFQQMGIENKFADTGVQRFFHELFAEACTAPNPPFVLHGLEVAGKLRAVTGSSICTGRIVCEFSSFADDDAAHASPGDFLFFENIREACQLGMSIYDFSVGDEPYKRLWCDREEIQFDCRIPLTAKGKLAAMAYRTAAEAKRAIKSNSTLWQTAKKIRRTVSGG
ncbi:MAG: GNAT family N-acetyltransferase [Rhizobiaceae bacterium]